MTIRYTVKEGKLYKDGEEVTEEWVELEGGVKLNVAALARSRRGDGVLEIDTSPKYFR